MEDNKIIKALECCGVNCSCKDCTYKKIPVYCNRKLMEDALDLINRQKAEIDRLANTPPKDPNDFCGVLCDFAESLMAKAKTEAIKEFAERLKKETTTAISCNTYTEVVRRNDIDNLVKEMVGDNNAE